MTTDRTTSRRPVLTGRALVLGGLAVLLLVLLASPVSRYLGSRSDIGEAAQQLQQNRHQLARLRHEKQLWSDPGFIQRQARQRLQYAMPGDTVYVVVDKGQQSDIAKTAGTSSSGRGKSTWNNRLMDSIRAAAR